MPLDIIRSDITTLRVDAIVSAANNRLFPDGGVCRAIHAAAGPRLREACRRLPGCKTGEACITPGFDLPARFVIHTVGPIWRGGKHGERARLTACYRSALALAVEHGCASIAFPLISSGLFGYPREQALTVATDAIRDFLLTLPGDADLMVYLVVYDRESFNISQERYNSIASYIDDQTADTYRDDRARRMREMEADTVREPDASFDASFPSWDDFDEDASWDGGAHGYAPRSPATPQPGERSADTLPDAFPDFGSSDFFAPSAPPLQEEECTIGLPPFSRPLPNEEPTARPRPERAAPKRDAAIENPHLFSISGAATAMPVARQAMPSLEDMLGMIDESFSQMLLRKIDERGIKDADCYKRANIDRKLFSKIRNDVHYRPKKTTALAFAIALRLPLEETKELLLKAGLALSPSDRFDIIVEYHIRLGKYDIFEINNALYQFDQPLLGGRY